MSSLLLGSLGVKLDALTAQFEADMEKAKSKLEGISATAKKVSIASGAAFAGMTAAIAVTSKAFDTQFRAEKGLEAAFKALGKEADIEGLKELASDLQKVTTFGDEATLSIASMLVPMGATSDTLKAVLPGVQDLAAGMGIDLRTAAQAVGKTLAGSSGALSRYIGPLSDVNKKIIESGTEQQKLAVIMGVLGKFQGQAAIAASTSAGKFQQLTNTMGDTLEKIGGIIDKPLGKVLDVVSAAATAVDDALKNLNPKTKEWIGYLAIGTTAALGVVAVLGALTAMLPALIGLLTVVGVAFLKAFWPVTAAIAVVIGAIAGTILATGLLKKAWDKNLFGIRDSVHLVVNSIKKAWVWLVDKLVVAWDWWAKAGRTVLQKVGEFFEKTVNGWIKIGRMLGEALNIDTLANLKDVKIDLTIDKAKEAGLTIGDLVKNKMQAAGDAIADVWNEGLDVWKTALGPLFDKFKSAVDQLVSAPALLPGGGGGGGSGGKPPGTDPPSGPSSSAIGTAAADETAMAVSAVSSGLGTFGRVMESLFTKGPIAAIIVLIGEVLKHTKTFGRILARFGDVLIQLATATEPLLEAIFPLVDVFFDLASVFIQLLIKFNPFIAILVALAPVFEIFARNLSSALEAMVKAFNAIIIGIGDFVGHIPVVGKELRKFVRKLMLTLYRPSEAPGAQDAVSSTADTLGGLDDAASDLGETMREVNAELSNIPDGFKVAAARFKAMDEDLGAAGLGGGALGQTTATAGVGTVIENVYIQSMNPDEAWEQLRGAVERSNFLAGGSIVAGSGPLSTAGNGA